jgi:hypothetical protein
VVYDSKITAMSLPGGQVWRWAYQRRQRVLHLAKLRCPQGKTGRLRESITAYYDPAAPRDHIIMQVAAETPYAAAVHEGAEPHLIYPSKSPRLVFWWEREGRKFVGRVGQPVHHPGIRHPQPFLREALEAVMRDL